MHRSQLLVAAAAAAALALPAPASAAVLVKGTFDALWSVEVAYTHKSFYESPATGGEQATFRLSGSLPGLQFENESLVNSVSRPIDQALTADAKTWLDNPDGDSIACAGTGGQAKGFAVVGQEAAATAGYAIWFAPLAGANIPLTCEKGAPPGRLSIASFARAPGGPAGSWARFTPTATQVDAPQWEMPVNIRITADDCPDWDPEYSVSCTLTVTGKVTFFRTARSEEQDLLAPDPPAVPPVVPPAKSPTGPKAPTIERPKLDRKAKKLRTSVSCQAACDVGIGVFAHRKNGKPYVKAVKSRTSRLEGGATPASVAVPLSSAQLRSLRTGKAATAKVTISMAGTTTVKTFTFKP